MKRFLALASLLVISLWPAAGAKAQMPDPEVISGTVAISSDLRAALESYLADFPPSSAPFYAPTYVKDNGASALVSLAGLNLQSPDDPWSLEAREDGTTPVVWIGTIRINADGSGQMFSTNQQARTLPHLAAPLIGPGGSPSVRLPFDPGKNMMYGVRLIHGSGDYGTSGMNAVDLVGGSSLGTNIASPTVYASFAGVIDYVCADDASVAVRTYDAASDNWFVYAHLLDNASLEVETAFVAGQTIGTLRSAAFDDSCGWAEQGDDIYHIHWMFEPSGGAYRVGTYTILLSDKKFHSGDKTYGSGDLIFNNLIHTGADDPSGVSANIPSIWDNIIAGIASVVTGTANLLPPRQNVGTLINGVMNTIVLSFRMAWLLARNAFYLQPIIAVAIILLSVRSVLFVVEIVFWAIRTFRLVKQAFFV